jgi:NTE family protein
MNRALVLSGGGTKGAFQCGAINYLVSLQNINYNILCGTSVGALNCSFLGMYNNKKEGIKDLLAVWKNLQTKDILKRHFPFGRLHGLLKPNLYNSNPLKNKIYKIIDVDKILSTQNKISIESVCLDTGQLKSSREFDKNFKEFVLASCSFPGLIEPVKIDNHLWLDGGIKSMTPLTNAIEMGADIIDVIICSPENNIQPMPSNSNSIEIIKRTLDLMVDSILDSDIKKAMLYNRLLEHESIENKRKVEINIIRPNMVLTYDSFSFNTETIESMIDIGYVTAKRIFEDKVNKA